MRSSQRIGDDNSVLRRGLKLSLNPDQARKRRWLLRRWTISESDLSLGLLNVRRKVAQRELFHPMACRLLRPITSPRDRHMKALACLRESNVREAVLLCELAHGIGTDHVSYKHLKLTTNQEM